MQSITLTSSIFNGFLQCPAAAMAQYEGRITGDKGITPVWRHPGSQAMACGSLLDAIVTRGFGTDQDARHSVEALAPVLESSYDDGTATAEWLLNKNGSWNAAAKRTVGAAFRLLSDPVAARIVSESEKQTRVAWEIDEGIKWEGDIDLLWHRGDGRDVIVDLKHPGRLDDGWIDVQGRAFKAPWYDVWQYWFQLTGYSLALAGQDREKRVNRLGILYVTQDDVPAVGFQPVAFMPEAFEMAVRNRLPAIRAIVEGSVEAPRCGRCGYCRSISAVVLPENGDVPIHAIDDKYGIDRDAIGHFGFGE